MKRTFNKNIIVAMLFTSSTMSVPVVNATGSVPVGATEITQILNNGELMLQVAKTAQVVQNTLASANSLALQLRHLPTNLMNEMLGNLGVDLKGVIALTDALKDAKKTYTQFEGMLEREMYAMQSMRMSPKDYLGLRINLASQKGGFYKQAMDADLKIIENAKEKAKTLESAMKNAQNIRTHVEGFQQLSAMNAQMISVLNEMSISVAQENASSNQERQDLARNTQAMAKALEAERVRRSEPRLLPQTFGGTMDLPRPPTTQ